MIEREEGGSRPQTEGSGLSARREGLWHVCTGGVHVEWWTAWTGLFWRGGAPPLTDFLGSLGISRMAEAQC